MANERGSVLIVEDEPDILEVEAMIVQDMGLEVHLARDGREALEVLDRVGSPCLVLLDLMMPRMGGQGFLEALQRRGPPVPPVVVVTAVADAPSDFDRTLVVAVVTKPFSVDQLEATVRRWCR